MTDDVLIVQATPNPGTALAATGGGVLALTAVIAAFAARLGLAVLLSWAALLIFAVGLAIGGTLLRVGLRRRRFGAPILTADALGIWVGLAGRRLPWADVHTIVIQGALAAPVGDVDLIRFQPDFTKIPGHHAALGRWIARTFMVRGLLFKHMQASKAEVIAGLGRAAQSAGYDLVPEPAAGPQTWRVMHRAAGACDATGSCP